METTVSHTRSTPQPRAWHPQHTVVCTALPDFIALAMHAASVTPRVTPRCTGKGTDTRCLELQSTQAHRHLGSTTYTTPFMNQPNNRLKGVLNCTRVEPQHWQWQQTTLGTIINRCGTIEGPADGLAKLRSCSYTANSQIVSSAAVLVLLVVLVYVARH